MRFLSQIDSTNEEIKRNLAENLPEGAVVIANHQTQGRGRQGRSWHSEPGTGLYLSTLLRPDLPLENLACITLMAGVATLSAIKHHASATLKWPNDILINGKKLAGILCECVVESGGSPAVILGIGINLNHTRMPENIQDTATSLKLETGLNVDHTDMAFSLLQSLNFEYSGFLQGKYEALIHKWTEQSDMFGKTVTVYQKGKALVGIALGLNPQGKLILQTPEGEQHILDSGEVSFNPI
jgi:BirA family transcriptional regulator, biotin operon repressor / biotin---[acetyl-CoA-carboxylase] ligase